MGWGTILGGAASIYGASQQKKAANAQADAAKDALAFQQQVFNTGQQNFAPYLDAGKQGLAALLGNDYEASPGYQYLKDEMVSGIDASAAARGQLYSGGHSLDLGRHIEGLAAQDYGNWWNRQMGLANLGQSSAAGVGAAGQAAANGMGSYYGQIGDAKATGYGANAGLAAGLGGLAQGLFSQNAPAPQTSSSFGVPGPVSPYSNTSWGQPSPWFG